MQKICIYGVGAIGGLIAARLALAGLTVAGIARGAQLDAIRRDGLMLLADGGTHRAPIRCVETPTEAGPQDVVILAMKSHQLPAIAAGIAPLLGPDTIVVTATNGLPWWYFHGLDLPDTVPLACVDPGGALWRHIGPERAVGAVVFPAAHVVRPGVVAHVFGTRISLGEPDGTATERVRALSAAFETAGFTETACADIRADLWTKLIANAAYNPVNILTGGTLGELLDDPGTHGAFERLMHECMAVAQAHGVSPLMPPTEILARTRDYGAHKTSMLQDMEAGRTVELDPIVGAVHELAGRLGVETPALELVLSLARQRARLAGC